MDMELPCPTGSTAVEEVGTLGPLVCKWEGQRTALKPACGSSNGQVRALPGPSVLHDMGAATAEQHCERWGLWEVLSFICKEQDKGSSLSGASLDSHSTQGCPDTAEVSAICTMAV